MKKDFKRIQPWFLGALVPVPFVMITVSNPFYVLSMMVWIQCSFMIAILLLTPSK